MLDVEVVRTELEFDSRYVDVGIEAIDSDKTVVEIEFNSRVELVEEVFFFFVVIGFSFDFEILGVDIHERTHVGFDGLVGISDSECRVLFVRAHRIDFEGAFGLGDVEIDSVH